VQHITFSVSVRFHYFNVLAFRFMYLGFSPHIFCLPFYFISECIFYFLLFKPFIAPSTSHIFLISLCSSNE
jgi:hypothetical protein